MLSYLVESIQKYDTLFWPNYSNVLSSFQPILFLVAFVLFSKSSFLSSVLRRTLQKLQLSHIVGCAFVLMLALGTWSPPEQMFHDESSYLLAADTFASGRLTNPTHPLWQFFETFHVIQQPSYQSKYLPGQGLVLAVGQVLTGNPYLGLWLFLALGMAVLYWALRPWLTQQWTLFGVALAATLVTFSDISQTLMFNPLALMGGCLVLGASGRIVNFSSSEPGRSVWTSCIRLGSMWGLGAALLIQSRPFEGFLLCAALLLWTLGNGLTGQPRRFASFLLLGIPVLLATTLSLALLAVYNKAVTGSYLQSAYSIHDSTYMVDPAIVWAKSNQPKPFNHPTLEGFYTKIFPQAFLSEWQLENPLHFFAANAVKLARFWRMYLGWALTPFLILGLWVFFGRPRQRMLFVLLAAVFLIQIVSTSLWLPSYALPLFPAVILLLVTGFRKLCAWHRSYHDEGKRLAHALLVCAVVSLPLVYTLRPSWMPAWQEKLTERRRLKQELAKIDGELLVFIEYQEAHLHGTEWVYNAADIDKAPIVFARDMGPEKNRELMAYYPERKLVFISIGLARHSETGAVVPQYQFRVEPNPLQPKTAQKHFDPDKS